MPDRISIWINGHRVTVPDGMTAAAAMIVSGVSGFRRSVSGDSRGPLCGMGICFECRATVDGIPQRRTCQMLVRNGMEIATDDGR